MSDRGLRYWLSWPHTRQDHVVAFAVLLAVTLVAGYLERPVVTLLAAFTAIVVGIRLMAWNAEKAAAGEEEDAPLTELVGMGIRGGSDDASDHRSGGASAPGGDPAEAHSHATGGADPAEAHSHATDGADPADQDGVDHTDERGVDDGEREPETTPD
jgi:hypothetical protein